MQQVDTLHPLRTLSSMPHISAAGSGARLMVPRQIMNFNIPDKYAPDGVLQFAIAPVQEDGQVAYTLYFEGRRVDYPQLSALMTTYRPVFEERLGQIPPDTAQRMYRDLGMNTDVPPYVFARALPRLDTPPPRHFSAPQPVVRDKRQERRTPRLFEVDLEEQMDEALEQIHTRVNAGTLSIETLNDHTGHFATIVDYNNGHVHQVGYSSERTIPWHVVFELRPDIDPAHGYYKTPVPRVIGGQVVFDTSHSKYMRPIYQRDYGADGGMAKQVMKETLGIMDLPRRYPSDPGYRGAYPSAPRSYPPAVENSPPWVRRLFSSGDYAISTPPQTPSSSQQRVSGKTWMRSDQPGMRASELIDKASLPAWLGGYEESTPILSPQLRAQVEGAQDNRPIIALHRRDAGTGATVQEQEYPLRYVSQQQVPIPTVQYTYDPVNFGGYKTHTSYSFI